MNLTAPQEPIRFVPEPKEKEDVKFPNEHSQQPIQDTILPYGYEDTKEYSWR